MKNFFRISILFLTICFIVNTTPEIYSQISGGTFEREKNFERREKFFEPKISDIKNTLPQPEFLTIKKGDKIKGKNDIKVKILNAQDIEFYLRRPSSLEEIYFGKGNKEDKEEWSLFFDSTNIPNGHYFLFTKIKTEYGTYESEEIPIEIENEPVIPPEEEKKKEELKKENIDQLVNIDQTLEKMQEEAKRKIKKEFEEKIEKRIEIFPKEIRTKIQPEIEKVKKNVEEEFPIKLKELKKVTEEEIKIEKEGLIEKREEIKKKRENIQKEIVQKIGKPIQEIEKILPQKEKEIIEKSSQEMIQKVEEIIQTNTVSIREKAKEKIAISEKAFQDSDFDGLYDLEEIRLGTNLLLPDSDNDGFLDGIEIKLGYDPLKTGPADKMVFGDPRKSGTVSKTITIEKVESTIEKDQPLLVLSGKGIPNSYLAIYIFSTPLVAMVKVSAEGIWEYKVEKPLPDGTHTVYVAYLNNKGEVEEKSSPFVFIKSGERIMKIEEFQATLPQSPAAQLQKSFLILVVSLIIFGLGVAFFIISGFRLKSQEKTKI